MDETTKLHHAKSIVFSQFLKTLPVEATLSHIPISERHMDADTKKRSRGETRLCGTRGIQYEGPAYMVRKKGHCAGCCKYVITLSCHGEKHLEEY